MFGFPISEKPESLRFANNTLQTATFQLQYQAVDFTGRRQEIIELIRDLMPQVRDMKHRTVVLSADNDEPVISSEDATGIGMEFKTESDDMVFTIKQDSMTLVIAGGSYTHFQDVFRYIEKTVYGVASLLGIGKFSRVAIRKVNVLGTKPPESGKQNFSKTVKDVFNENLVGPAIHLPPADKLNSYVTNCYFVDGYNNLNLVYGLLPQQENMEDRQLLLDIDIFHSREETSLEESKSLFVEINNEVFNVYMWSLTPLVKALLQQRNHSYS